MLNTVILVVSVDVLVLKVVVVLYVVVVVVLLLVDVFTCVVLPVNHAISVDC